MKKEINFRRITSPKGKDFERLWKIYEKCFPIRDEREVKRNILGITKGHPHEDGEKYVESFLLSINVNGRPAGGAIFDYAEGRICGRKAGFGINWYLFVNNKYRQRGLGKLTHEKRLEILRAISAERKASLDLMVCELNDPQNMKVPDREKDRKVMNPHERLEFFHKIGFRRIDTRFNYIQPQLTVKSHPCEELMLCILPLKKDFRREMPAEYLKQLLRLYVWAGFEGIPGSNVNGHRNPDTDRACREMMGQLEMLERREKRISLLPLESRQGISIKPLTKKTLGSAIKLLGRTFPYEKELPEICLRASLNPRPYRKIFAKRGTVGLKYWTALDRREKVIGMVGLYSYKKDRKEASWLGWFAVSPGCRKHGVGTKLLNFAIYNAKLTGKRYLRLYTSMHPNELESHRLYEERGFVKVREEDTPGWKGKKIVYEMGLREK